MKPYLATRASDWIRQATAFLDERCLVPDSVKEGRAIAAELEALGSVARFRKIRKRKSTMAQLRDAVMARAQGHCEFCQEPRTYLELAHLVGGIGRRRQLQKLENCAAACHSCHLRYDRFPTERLAMLWKWSSHTGIPIPPERERLAHKEP